MSDFPEIKIPFWMNGPHVRTLAGASRVWFGRLGEWAAFPLRQADPMTCSERMLDLIAWQRGVTRAAGEAERLYRLRVAHAYPTPATLGRSRVGSGFSSGWNLVMLPLMNGKLNRIGTSSALRSTTAFFQTTRTCWSSLSPTTGGRAGDTILFPGFRKRSPCGSSPLTTIIVRSAPRARNC